MKLGMLVAVAATMMSGAANAADWRLVGVGRGGATAIDISSVSRSGNLAVVWTALLFSAARDRTDYILVRQEYDCRQVTSTFLSTISYDEEGMMIERNDGRRSRAHVAPDTMEMQLLEAACFDRFQVEDVEGWSSLRTLLTDYRSTVD